MPMRSELGHPTWRSTADQALLSSVDCLAMQDGVKQSTPGPGMAGGHGTAARKRVTES